MDIIKRLEKAGAPRRGQRDKSATPEQIDEIKKAYEAGYRVKDIATQVGLSVGKCYRVLRKEGVNATEGGVRGTSAASDRSVGHGEAG
jgi:hypothetical protein